MKQLIKKLLFQCIDNLDAGNSDLTEKECIEVIELLKKYTHRDKKLSKYQACRLLQISRATFDNYVREGKLPKGKKEIGFKELFWNEEELRKCL